MAGFTACTQSASTTYNLYSGTTPTIHPVATVEVYVSGNTWDTQERVQCGNVKLGGNGVFN
jgi:hypothetical protein